ncbi:MAG: hypothetical protein ACN6LP_00255 [Candidatus Carsonella ruddii]
MIFITLPKGRNFLISLYILNKIKLKLLEIIFRKILLKTNRKDIFIIIFKNKDLLKIINFGVSNICISGSDIEIKNLKKIKIKKIKSCIFLNNNFFIFTKLFNILNYYNLNLNIIKFNGSLEFFVKNINIINNINNGILDIKETNTTLYENFLFPKKILKKISIYLIYKNLKKKIFFLINKKC